MVDIFPCDTSGHCWSSCQPVQNVWAYFQGSFHPFKFYFWQTALTKTVKWPWLTATVHPPCRWAYTHSHIFVLPFLWGHPLTWCISSTLTLTLTIRLKVCLIQKLTLTRIKIELQPNCWNSLEPVKMGGLLKMSSLVWLNSFSHTNTHTHSFLPFFFLVRGYFIYSLINCTVTRSPLGTSYCHSL